MSKQEEEIEQIHVSIEELKKSVELSEQLRSLMKNTNFKKVIEDEYLKEEAIRLTTLLGSPDERLDKVQKFIIKDLEGIAAFRRFLSKVLSMGNQAQDQIMSFEEELDHLTSDYANIDTVEEEED